MSYLYENATNIAIGGAIVLYGLYQAWQRLPSFRLPSLGGKAGPTPEDDRQTVLAIQGRLSAAGNDKAAATAYQLLGEMKIVKG